MWMWFREPRFSFLRPARWLLGVSALLVLLGLWSLWRIMAGQANLGTDFSGGAMVHLSSAGEVDLSTLRKVLTQAGWKAQVQNVRLVGDDRNRWLIRTGYESGKLVGETSEAVLALLQENFPKAGWRLEGGEEVGPSVSAKLRRDALKAFLIASLGILIYIAFRFDWKFGLAALIATVHDVLAALAFIVFTDTEFNLLAVTALLTLAGYSLNDTVVIFDRIRENSRWLSKETYVQVVNRSLNETLNRTLNTSGTTLLAVVALWIFVQEPLKSFAAILIFGILIGTYSSIWVASALLVLWHRRRIGSAV